MILLYGTAIEINKTKRIFVIWIYWFRISFLYLYAEKYDHEAKGVCDSWLYLLCLYVLCPEELSEIEDFKALRFTWLNCMHDVTL